MRREIFDALQTSPLSVGDLAERVAWMTGGRWSYSVIGVLYIVIVLLVVAIGRISRR